MANEKSSLPAATEQEPVATELTSCHWCAGTGFDDKHPCGACRGSGTLVSYAPVDFPCTKPPTDQAKLIDEQRAEARKEALEEAALIASSTTAYDDNLNRSAGCATTGQRIASAILARNGSNHND